MTRDVVLGPVLGPVTVSPPFQARSAEREIHEYQAKKQTKSRTVNPTIQQRGDGEVLPVFQDYGDEIP